MNQSRFFCGLGLFLAMLAVNATAPSSARAAAALECKMRANECGFAGATIVLPWEGSVQDPANLPYRASVNAPFTVYYGYEHATGSILEGSLLIRDEAPGLGAYWGLVGRDRTYFAIVASDGAGGWRAGINGCADGPRVWSESCSLESME